MVHVLVYIGTPNQFGLQYDNAHIHVRLALLRLTNFIQDFQFSKELLTEIMKLRNGHSHEDRGFLGR